MYFCLSLLTSLKKLSPQVCFSCSGKRKAAYGIFISMIQPNSVVFASLSQIAFHEPSSPSEDVKFVSICPLAAVTKNLNSCCPSLYPLIKTPKKSDVPISSLSTSSFNILEGSGSYNVAPIYMASSVYKTFTSVLNSFGIGVPFLGSNETKSVAISAFSHDFSFKLASIEINSDVLVVAIVFFC